MCCYGNMFDHGCTSLVFLRSAMVVYLCDIHRVSRLLTGKKGQLKKEVPSVAMMTNFGFGSYGKPRREMRLRGTDCRRLYMGWTSKILTYYGIIYYGQFCETLIIPDVLPCGIQVTFLLLCRRTQWIECSKQSSIHQTHVNFKPTWDLAQLCQNHGTLLAMWWPWKQLLCFLLADQPRQAWRPSWSWQRLHYNPQADTWLSYCEFWQHQATSDLMFSKPFWPIPQATRIEDK